MKMIKLTLIDNKKLEFYKDLSDIESEIVNGMNGRYPICRFELGDYLICVSADKIIAYEYMGWGSKE